MYPPEKLIYFKYFDTYLSHNYQPSDSLFINSKCKELPTQKSNFIFNIFMNFLAHNLSTLYRVIYQR
jgi:hypothetical protein